MFEDENETIAELAEAERVTDPSAVYDDVDSLPEWWRDLVYEFAERDLRPYRPSRFAEGEIVYEAIRNLQARFGVEITIKSTTPTQDDKWEFVVDGTTAVVTTQERKPSGYTEYGVTKEELVEAVSEVASNTS